MAFPSGKELNSIRKKLEKAPGFRMLAPNATELEKFRFKICQELLGYAMAHKFNSGEMAKRLGIPKADMSRIFNHRIDRFSTDRLVGLYAKINPSYKLKVA